MPALLERRLHLIVIFGIICSLWLIYSRNYNHGVKELNNKRATDKKPEDAPRSIPLKAYVGSQGSAISPSQEKTVAMRMDLPDTQHKWPWGKDHYHTKEKCEQKKYDHSQLKPASVIICFHESENVEHLLHTVHSVIQHSPPDLLHEVILVDDNSHNVMHNAFLNIYVDSVFGSKVRIIRHRGEETLGVIAARILGISKASGPVVITLDAHMEARKGWLEPLLYEISKDPRTLASISLDWVKPQKDGTWIYKHGQNDAINAWFWQGFAFSLWEQENPENTKRLREDPTQPFLVACTIGHCAMDRNFFNEIGGLDPGMQLWGGENIDIAIRTYLWNGHVLAIPCSHVAHLEDDFKGVYRFKKGLGHKLDNNYKRIVEVWLDDYKDTFYYYNPVVKASDAGNLTERMQVKARCPNTFKTFMDKGYPWLGNTFGRNIARGGLRCSALPKLTMYWSNPWTYGMRYKARLPINQEIFLTVDGYLRYDLGVFNAEKGAGVEMKFTSHTTFKKIGNDTRWIHRKGGLMISMEYENYCMQCSQETIVMANCDADNPYQQWIFAEYTQHYMDLCNGKLLDSGYLKQYHKYLSS